MPTYDYICRSCGHQFELFQNITDEPERVCPKCKKDQVERVLSGGSGLIFKGSGFYITDYKNKKSSGSTPKKDEPKSTDK